MAESQRSLKNIPPREGLLIGLLFSGMGVLIELLSFGVIDPEGGMNVPAEIGAVAGGIFLLPGLLSMYYAIRNYLGVRNNRPEDEGFDVASWVVTSLILSAFTVVGLWISLAGRSESFSGGITGSVSEIRIAFGIGAILCAAAAAFTWGYGFKKLKKKRK